MGVLALRGPDKEPEPPPRAIFLKRRAATPNPVLSPSRRKGIVLAALLLASAAHAQPPSAEAQVRAALARIAALDRVGPQLNAVIALDPTALDQARALDAARAKGPLAGLPILIKDNVETAGPVPTTAGSLALLANIPNRDAPLVARLRRAGAVILGKANLSEWANFRSDHSISGWTAVGGLVKNPYALDRTACGSSSGSAAAVAAGYVRVAIGSETDGSITCPASMNGLVGFKPTLGLVSRTGVVPISPEQDTAGPIALTVRDAAAVLTAIAGSDRADPATASADAHKADYVADLDAKALKGARIGVVRGWVKGPPAEEQVFAAALTRLRAAGAVLVEVPLPPAERRRMLDDAETTALEGEFHTALDAYLASTPAAVKTRSLTDLIAFDKATPAEMALFGQDIFEDSAKLDAKAVASARALAHQIAGPEGLDRMFAAAQVEAIVSETESPAAVVDPVDGTNYLGSASTLPAVAGYPHLTVPMGQVAGLPVGLSFIGPAWSDARILALGYAYEQASHAARPPTFPLTITLKAAAAQP